MGLMALLLVGCVKPAEQKSTLVDAELVPFVQRNNPADVLTIKLYSSENDYFNDQNPPCA